MLRAIAWIVLEISKETQKVQYNFHYPTFKKPENSNCLYSICEFEFRVWGFVYFFDKLLNPFGGN